MVRVSHMSRHSGTRVFAIMDVPSDANDVLLSISSEDSEEEMFSEAESGYWTVVNFSLDMDFWALVQRDFLVGQAIVDSGWSSVNFWIIFILISTSFGDNNIYF